MEHYTSLEGDHLACIMQNFAIGRSNQETCCFENYQTFIISLYPFKIIYSYISELSFSVTNNHLCFIVINFFDRIWGKKYHYPYQQIDYYEFQKKIFWESYTNGSLHLSSFMGLLVR